MLSQSLIELLPIYKLSVISAVWGEDVMMRLVVIGFTLMSTVGSSQYWP